MGATTEQVIADGQKYVMNTYGRLPMVIDRGEGCYVWDLDGKRYLDLVAGIAVNSLGHSHPAVVQAIQEQSAKLMHCSNLYWIENQVKLAKLLVEKSGLGKAFFCNSGAEANEAAIKLARKWGHGEKYHIITMQKSFHGRTLGSLAATAQEISESLPPAAGRVFRRAVGRPGGPGAGNPAGDLRRHAGAHPGGERHQRAHPGLYAGRAGTVQEASDSADSG